MLDLQNEDIKQGALDALNIILDSKHRKIRINASAGDNDHNGEKLQMPKNSEIVGDDFDGEMGEDETFKDPEDSQRRETEDERQARIDRLNKTVDDPEELELELANIALDKEERENKKVRASKANARKAASGVGSGGGKIKGFSEFKRDLKFAMNKQVTVSKKPEDTYSRINPTYAHTDLLMPGSGYVEKRNVPLINVYWDESGSLTSTDIENGREALSYLLKLEKEKKIKVENYWFGSNVTDSPEKVSGGTRAFPLILKHIKDTRANNVIIFTDNDFDDQTVFSEISPINISGCIWWIWCGRPAKKAAQYIVPRIKSNKFEYKMR